MRLSLQNQIESYGRFSLYDMGGPINGGWFRAVTTLKSLLARYPKYKDAERLLTEIAR